MAIKSFSPQRISLGHWFLVGVLSQDISQDGWISPRLPRTRSSQITHSSPLPPGISQELKMRLQRCLHTFFGEMSPGKFTCQFLLTSRCDSCQWSFRFSARFYVLCWLAIVNIPHRHRFVGVIFYHDIRSVVITPTAHRVRTFTTSMQLP